MEQRMITLWNKDVPDEDKGELEAELRAQKWLYRLIEKAHSKLLVEDERQRESWIRDNKIVLCETYMNNLEAMISQIEFYIPRKARTEDRGKKSKRKKQEARERYRAQVRDGVSRFELNETFMKEGINLQWNKELFLTVGRDRGYQTEEALVYAVQKELNLSRVKAKMLVDKGKFTWGQVMCIGAMLEMMPREFCDVFMSGYFVEYMGEYYASYENINKSALLHKRVLPSEADTE